MFLKIMSKRLKKYVKKRAFSDDINLKLDKVFLKSQKKY